jgi:hypothetical protein
MIEKSFYFGHAAGLNIPFVLESETEILSRYKLAMITVIDSNHDVANLKSVAGLLEDEDLGITTIDSHLVVPCELVPELVAFERNLFNGFDEIWFLEGTPSEPRPEDLVITADVVLDGERAQRVAVWLDAAGAGLGLGDGDGLNWVTLDARIAAVLESWPSHGSTGTGD